MRLGVRVILFAALLLCAVLADANLAHAKSDGSANKPEPGGILHWYEHESQIGIIARRVVTDSSSRTLQVTFYRGDYELLQKDFGSPFRVDPKAWGANPEHYLKPYYVERYGYDGQGRESRIEYLTPEGQLYHILDKVYEVSGQRWISRNDKGIRQQEQTYGPKNATLVFDETGEKVIAISGHLPEKVEMAQEWGSEVKGLVCTIAAGSERRGPFFPPIPGRVIPSVEKDPLIYLTIRNLSGKDVEYRYLSATGVEFELADSNGSIVAPTPNSDILNARRRETLAKEPGGMSQLRSGAAIMQSYRLRDWYSSLPSGTYVLQVRRRLNAKGPELVSQKLHIRISD